MANFTPTSSIAWTQNHAFAMGMEANFTNPADKVASITQNIPFSIGELQIFGGSLTIRRNCITSYPVASPSPHPVGPKGTNLACHFRAVVDGSDPAGPPKSDGLEVLGGL